MTDNQSVRDVWAVVFGATEKSISEFSETLAAKNINLILIDRDKSYLQRKANELYQKYSVRVEAIPIDPDAKDAEITIMERIRELDVTLLVPHESVNDMGELIRNNLEKNDIRMNTHKAKKLNVYATRYFAETANDFIEIL